MPQHQKLLIVIADGEHVRFVRAGSDNALHSDAAFDSVSAHKRAVELGTDQPGAAFHSRSSAHHGFAPRHDLHDLEKEEFARLIAHQLNASASRGEFDELVIVAPAHSLRAIREELDTSTNAKIVGMLAKNLVKTPDHKLWPHVRVWVRPVHRPPG
jgi:protein required for attachment to host cells